MRTGIAVAALIVLTGVAYVKWAKSLIGGVAEDMWHAAFDALLNP